MASEAPTQGFAVSDGQWRKTITILDAIAGGCDLFDLEQLQLEYDEDKFQQLFMQIHRQHAERVRPQGPGALLFRPVVVGGLRP
jgi:hypothetical protein